MTQTEWIISLDDDLKDHDELFVGNVRDGDRLTRCKDCIWEEDTRGWQKWCKWHYFHTNDYEFCSWAERKEE